MLWRGVRNHFVNTRTRTHIHRTPDAHCVCAGVEAGEDPPPPDRRAW